MDKLELKLTNTLSRHQEAFKPLKAGQVSLYTCGPTVYDYAHIGNLRTYITEDLLRRTLKLAGYQVKHVMNLTDVDDKTIARSRRDHPDIEPHAALIKLTRHFEAEFLADTAALNIDFSSSRIVRATEHIETMKQLITQIHRAGWAYLSADGVYFDISKYIAAGHRYGQLTKVDFNPQARINNDDYDKLSAADFALWKRAQPGEPSWEFQIDHTDLTGRPGWHIECSAMSTQYLGQPFDIHTGGIDLTFPHHENEIAQSSVGHKLMAQTFMHFNHLLVDGTKMSKRLNNFYTLRDLTGKGFHPLAFRLLALQAHYSSELNFTWQSLEAAQNALLSLYAWADLQFQTFAATVDLDQPYSDKLAGTQRNITSAVTNDLNSAGAIAYLYQFIDGTELIGATPDNQQTFQRFLQFLDALFGLELTQRHDLSARLKRLIEDRETARQTKNFTRSDQIRHDLAKEGIMVEDTPYGPRWRRSSLT